MALDKKQLTEHRHRTVYVKITKVGQEETTIDGYATGGSINIDGASAVRRSCNITLVTNNVQLNEYDWVFKTQFELKIGLRNMEALDNSGEAIEWFPQGIYVITSFSATLNANSYTINISGQDKMCLLNGEVSGALVAETDFGKYDQLDADGNIVETIHLTIDQIIRNAVHTYAQEPFGNIIIETPNKSGANLLEYRGDKPMYLLISESKESTENENQTEPEYKINNLTIYGDQPGNSGDLSTRIDSLDNYFVPASLNNKEVKPGEKFKGGYVQRIEYGQSAGYEQTDLIYAGDLVAAAGETVVSILDKIKAMLGEYEYFYNIDGKFIFQKKKTSLKTLWNNDESNGGSSTNINEQATYAYEFNDLSLFTSIANTPNLKNLKNDFTVWGKRKSISGAELPIHMRLAIDKKPTAYTNKAGTKYVSSEYDWRELIYQMARDYNFYKNNNMDMVRTGYEPYYQDLLGYWRQLYNPEVKANYTPAFYNDSGDLYAETWVSSTGNEPFTDWHVLKESYYIPWLDSLNLDLGQATTLRDLYVYDGEYKPLLTQNFLPAPYYIIDSGNNKVAIEQAGKITSDDMLKNLYYKAKDKPGYESIIKYIDLKEIDVDNNTAIYLSDMLARGSGTSVYKTIKNIKINNILKGSIDLTKSANLIELIESYKDPNTKIEFQYEDTSAEEWILKTPLIQFYAQKKDFKDDCNYAVYFLNSNGEYELYAKYLATKGDRYGNKLDEFDLYTMSANKKDLIHLVDLVSFDRMKVYVKTFSDIGDGNRVVQYLPLGEYMESKLLDKKGFYILKLNADIAITTPRPQFEVYYKTNYKGSLDKNIAYQRPIKYYKKVEDYDPVTHWHKNVAENPEGLLFWFDFLDPEEQTKEELRNLNKFSCKIIGNRNMVKTESMVTAIYYPNVPKVYYHKDFQMPESLKDLFVVSAQGLSAHDAIDNWLYNHTYVTESVTINSVPIYHLQPNERIRLNSEKILGDYFVDKLTIPLAYNGTMTITATKAPVDIGSSLSDKVN